MLHWDCEDKIREKGKNMKELCAVVLAAGQGKRMGAAEAGIPKVMFEVLGKPMIRYAVDHLHQAGVDNIILVVGFQKEKVMEYFGDEMKYAIQDEQLGTGHAVAQARDQALHHYQATLVHYGDHVLYQPDTIKKLVDVYEKEQPTIAMLTNFFDDPMRYAFGRIIRNQEGEIIGSCEQKDCTPEQLKIKECNPCFYIFNTKWLFENLEKLKNDNSQGEYYLTDLVGLAVEQGKKISSVTVDDWRQVIGINNPEHLKEVEKYLEE